MPHSLPDGESIIDGPPSPKNPDERACTQLPPAAAPPGLGTGRSSRHVMYVAPTRRLVDWMRRQLVGPPGGDSLRQSPLDRFPTGVLHPIDPDVSGIDRASSGHGELSHERAGPADAHEMPRLSASTTRFVLPCSGSKRRGGRRTAARGTSVLRSLPRGLAAELRTRRSEISSRAKLDESALLPAGERYTGTLCRLQGSGESPGRRSTHRSPALRPGPIGTPACVSRRFHRGRQCGALLVVGRRGGPGTVSAGIRERDHGEAIRGWSRIHDQSS